MIILRYSIILFSSLLLMSSCYDKTNELGYYENGSFYYTSGQMGNGIIKNKLKSGPWVFYDNQRKKISAGKFTDDKMNGKWTFYYSNGQIERKGTYSNGDLHGKWEYFFPSGQLMSMGNFNSNFRTGRWDFWYSNNTKKESRNYNSSGNYLINSWFEDGTNMVTEGNGEYFYKDNSGIVLEHGYYQNGLPIGEWKYYDFSGTLLRKEIFKNPSRIN